MFCKQCGFEIESESTFCENCGKPIIKKETSSTFEHFDTSSDCLEKKWYQKKWCEMNGGDKKKVYALWVICGIALAVIMLAILIPAFSNNEKATLTYENYQKIQTGMTYSAVCEIFGSSGKEDVSSSTTIPGYGEYSLQYYTWQNSAATRIIVIGFENGKVIAKSQIGL